MFDCPRLVPLLSDLVMREEDEAQAAYTEQDELFELDNNGTEEDDKNGEDFFPSAQPATQKDTFTTSDLFVTVCCHQYRPPTGWMGTFFLSLYPLPKPPSQYLRTVFLMLLSAQVLVAGFNAFC